MFCFPKCRTGVMWTGLGILWTRVKKTSVMRILQREESESKVGGEWRTSETDSTVTEGQLNTLRSALPAGLPQVGGRDPRRGVERRWQEGLARQVRHGGSRGARGGPRTQAPEMHQEAALQPPMPGARLLFHPHPSLPRPHGHRQRIHVQGRRLVHQKGEPNIRRELPHHQCYGNPTPATATHRRKPQHHPRRRWTRPALWLRPRPSRWGRAPGLAWREQWGSGAGAHGERLRHGWSVWRGVPVWRVRQRQQPRISCAIRLGCAGASVRVRAERDGRGRAGVPRFGGRCVWVAPNLARRCRSVQRGVPAPFQCRCASAVGLPTVLSSVLLRLVLLTWFFYGGLCFLLRWLASSFSTFMAWCLFMTTFCSLALFSVNRVLWYDTILFVWESFFIKVFLSQTHECFW